MIVINTVKTIINDWDPLNLLSHAPDDEYNTEIKEIEKLLETTKNCTDLAEGIYSIFIRFFGENSFKKSKPECILIAQRILSTSRTQGDGSVVLTD